MAASSVTWRAAKGVVRVELTNPPGWELIRVQFFNYGTLSEPLPRPPHHPSMDTLHLSVFLYFLII